MKIDMNKAYDRVEWDFLNKVMKKMGFNSKWVTWIMQCVNTVIYNIMVSGKVVREVTPSRGLKTRRPIGSLSLFVGV